MRTFFVSIVAVFSAIALGGAAAAGAIPERLLTSVTADDDVTATSDDAPTAVDSEDDGVAALVLEECDAMTGDTFGQARSAQVHCYAENETSPPPAWMHPLHPGNGVHGDQDGVTLEETDPSAEDDVTVTAGDADDASTTDDTEDGATTTTDDTDDQITEDDDADQTTEEDDADQTTEEDDADETTEEDDADETTEDDDAETTEEDEDSADDDSETGEERRADAKVKRNGKPKGNG